MNGVKYTGLIVVAILALSIIGAALPVTSALSSNTYPISSSSIEHSVSINKTRVAEIIINRVLYKIERVMDLAQAYNIGLPENLSSRVDQAYELINNASVIVDEKPCEAIKLALRAEAVFMPVARYVLANIPVEDREEMRKEALLRSIEAKLDVIDNIRARIEWLENKSIPVIDEVNDLLDDAESKLLEAEYMVEEGNYSVSEVAHLIAEASKDIGRATALLYKFAGRAWAASSMVEHGLKCFAYSLFSVGRAINATLDAIGSGDNETVSLYINISIERIDKLVLYLNKSIEIIVNRTGETNFTLALEILRDSLLEAREHLVIAQEYLGEGDLLSAEAEAEEAFNVLKNGAEQALPYLRGLYHLLEKIKDYAERAREEIREKWRHIIERKAAQLIMFIGRIDLRLHKAYRLYLRGIITEEQFNNTLNKAQHILEILKNRLEELPRPPEKLIAKIDEILKWINSVRP
ncbi:MAG: hypothetical protein J7K21_07585 [Desulfurococcales archaeon]|nr:hypothetical protein [Desulfurococcales archaeon]